MYSGILTVLLLIAMQSFDAPLNTTAAPNGIVSFELAKDMDVSQIILSSWDETAKVNAGLSLGFDFLFLIAYSIFLASLCYAVAKRFKERNKWIYKLGLSLAVFQFVAALFDIIENIALIKLLLGSQNGVYSTLVFYFASIKFILIILGLLYIIIGFITSLFLNKSTST